MNQIIQTIKTDFKNGIKLDQLGLSKLKQRLQSKGIEYQHLNDNSLKNMLARDLIELDDTYHHIDNLFLEGTSISSVLNCLFEAFNSGYKRIYTDKLLSFYHGKISNILDQFCLGALVSAYTGSGIVHKDKEGFLQIATPPVGKIEEVYQVCSEIILHNTGIDRQGILLNPKVQFYSDIIVNKALDKIDKQSKNTDLLGLVYKHNDEYFHIENIAFSSSERASINQEKKELQESSTPLLEQTSKIVDVANYITQNNKEYTQLANQLLDIANRLIRPCGTFDIDALYSRLSKKNYSWFDDMLAQYGSTILKAAVNKVDNEN